VKKRKREEGGGGNKSIPEIYKEGKSEHKYDKRVGMTTQTCRISIQAFNMRSILL